MQIQTSSSRALSTALQTVAKCIGKNTLSILDNVLLTRKDGQFYFTASTQDSQLTIPAPLTLINGNFNESVALPVNGIISYLGTLPDCVVNITLNDNHSLVLDYCTGKEDSLKAGEVKLTYLSGAEFPLFPERKSEDMTHLTFPASVFLNAITNAQNFVATDELRVVLNCLCIDMAEDLSRCFLVATNGHKLIKITHTNDPKTGGSDFYRGGACRSMLIHSSYFKMLSAFSSCETVDVESDGHIIRITSGDIEFECRATDGNYPKYDSVIPKNGNSHVCFDKKEMLSVVKRVSIFGSASSQLIKIQKDGMFINLSAQDIDYATSAKDQVLLTASECEDGFAIGFHAQTFANVLSAIPGDIVRMSLYGAVRASTFTDDTPNPNVMSLAMPMLLE